jgi:CRP-like cAMP-binding protein
MREQELQYGEPLHAEPGTVLYKTGDRLEGASIYYITAGLVRVDLELAPAAGGRLSVYLHPDSVFGLVETRLVETHPDSPDSPRLTSAICLESSILYHWDREGFDLASSVSWELAFNTITGLTQYLRVLNAEFAIRLGQLQVKGPRAGS